MKDQILHNTELLKSPAQIEKLQQYYRFHSGVYDMTRWSYLFGRKHILQLLPDLPHNPNIVEIGCGTGKNLERLEYLFPDGMIYGIDLSEAMIRKAQRRFPVQSNVRLIHTAYGFSRVFDKPINLMLLSYSLTMTGENIEHVLQQIYEDLSPNGYVAVVDFHTTPLPLFRTWMKKNHVDINGHLLPLLRKFFIPLEEKIKSVYFGLWSYVMFVGKRN